MKMKSVVVAQTMSEEAVVCTAMKEDRHQNIMSSVALKKGVEEPWTIEKVELGYREITLKSDTELAIIAFRNRLAEMCKAEVTTEDKLKLDRESNGLIENAVMLLRGIIRIIKCHIESSTQERLSDESLILPWLVEHAGCILSKRVVTGRRLSKNCMARSRHKNLFVSCVRKYCHNKAPQIHKQFESQIEVRDLAWNAKQQCRMCHWQYRWCFQSS